MPKVSVIIPVFGVEDYIEKCSRSLFEQSLDDIEYIFIDDCSKDKSVEILETVIKEYPSRETQVKIFRMPQNSGQAKVREKGISLATGDYIIHCDSDDWVSSDMYAQMYAKAVKDKLDVVICGVEECYGETTSYRNLPVSSQFDLVKEILLNNGYLFNKLVKREIVHKECIVYPVSNIGEDMVLSAQYGINANQWGVVPAYYYHYERRSGSATGFRTLKRIVEGQDSMKKNFVLVMNVLKENGIDNKYEDIIIHQQLSIKNLVFPAIKQDYRYYKYWKDTFPNITLQVLKSQIITVKEKIVYLFLLIRLIPAISLLKNYIR